MKRKRIGYPSGFPYRCRLLRIIWQKFLVIFRQSLILTLIRFFRESRKKFCTMAIYWFRWTSYSGNSHAGPLSRTLLFLRAGTKIPVFRRFGLQGMPLCLLSNHRPAAFLSVCKAGAEIQNRKDYAWSSRAEYSCFIDKHNRSWICAIGEKRTTQTRKRTV